MADTELAALKRKVTEIEGEISGEKIVTRHILEQLRANTEILLEMRKEMGQFRLDVAEEFTSVHGELSSLRQYAARLGDQVAIDSAQLEAIGPKLSGLVADALRDAWKTRERN